MWKRHIAVLLFAHSNFIVALLLFSSGFLLNRLEIEKHSSHKPCHNASLSYDCPLKPAFERAIIIVIDALRYDFVSSNFTAGRDEPFQNKLKFVAEVLKSQPENSALYKFIADPPTTTLQRLKGITTGSLPTFVDAGSNFAGSDILEDNLINQMFENGMNMTFMGDDVWLSLFPKQFTKAFPFPALNVKDLDTLDNGVTAHLSSELNRGDWNLMLAHFLGVDHCGHTYGPYHPKMTEKLRQMDKVLKSVVESMSDDTVLFVLGDHGMTKTGDHGGDSKDELEAALFVYSPKKIRSRQAAQNAPLTVKQVDIVPTFSLLMGLPIPFSNLGMAITELFSPSAEGSPLSRLAREAEVLYLNARQVREYLHSYSAVSDEFPFAKMEELEEEYQSATQLYISASSLTVKEKGAADLEVELKAAVSKYRFFLLEARRMCEEIWAKFDHVAMVCGVMSFIFTLVFFVTMKVPSCLNSLTLIAIVGNISVILVLVILILSGVTVSTTVLYFCTSIGAFPVAAYILLVKTSSAAEKKKQHKWFQLNLQPLENGLFLLMLVFYLLGFFSNSFVVYEDSVTSFLIQSSAWILLLKIHLNTKRPQGKTKLFAKGSSTTGARKLTRFDIGRIITSPRAIALMLTLTFCFLMKLSSHFRACREEQWTCETSSFLQPISAITDDLRLYKNFRYFFAVSVMSIIPIVAIKWTRYHGNLNGSTPVSLVVQYLLPMSVVCVAFHLAMQAMSAKLTDKISPWQQMLFAKGNYVLFIVSTITICLSPLCVYLLPRENKNLPFTNSEDCEFMPKLYSHLKTNWKQYLKHKIGDVSGADQQPAGSSGSNPPVVYGLATVYSAPVIALTATCTVLLVMLLNDGLAPALVIQLVVMAVFLELYACVMNLEKCSSEKSFSAYEVPWYITMCWCLICSHFFYATGHQATIPSIRFEAAFVGLSGDFDVMVIPGLLVLLNTFASHVIGILALPLLIMWPRFRGKLLFHYEKEKGGEKEKKGEFVLFEDQSSFKKSLFHLMSTYTVISAAKLLFTMLAAGIHRRHLMVWKIFAPRFLFEGATFLFTCLMSWIVYFVMLRIHWSVTKFVKKLQ